MNTYLDLNLASFQYIDGFGCYHFCLNSIGIDDFLLNFFAILASLLETAYYYVTFGSVLGLQVIIG